MNESEIIGIILIAAGFAQLIVLYHTRQESSKLSFSRTDDGSLLLVKQSIDFQPIFSKWIAIVLSYSVCVALSGYLLDGFFGLVIMLFPILIVVLAVAREIQKLRMEPIDRFEKTLDRIESIAETHSTVFRKQLDYHIESVVKNEEEKLALFHYLSNRDDAIGTYASERLTMDI